MRLDNSLNFLPFWTPLTVRHRRRVGSVAGKTAFTFAFPLFPRLTHLTRRVLGFSCLGRAHIQPRARPRQRQASAAQSPPLPLYLCTFSPTSYDNLSCRAALRLSGFAYVFYSSVVLTAFADHVALRWRLKRLLANRLATLTILPGRKLPLTAQFSFVHSRSIRDRDLFLSGLFPDSQLGHSSLAPFTV